MFGIPLLAPQEPVAAPTVAAPEETRPTDRNAIAQAEGLARLSQVLKEVTIPDPDCHFLSQVLVDRVAYKAAIERHFRDEPSVLRADLQELARLLEIDLQHELERVPTWEEMQREMGGRGGSDVWLLNGSRIVPIDENDQLLTEICPMIAGIGLSVQNLLQTPEGQAQFRKAAECDQFCSEEKEHFLQMC